ncbi:MAG: dihydroorotate dehydrogenase electron transfer subunit [Clostridia bacterium]|nr:dihydroorotate dehydrogenase electron transfer subunit [Clostridia bacterium]
MQIKNILSKLIENKKIGKDVYLMSFSDDYLAQNLKSGQFLNVWCDKTLRRPISVANIDKDKNIITLIYQIKGEGTKILSKKKIGDTIDVVGPLGNGFPEIYDKKVLLVGGGIGSIPLLYAAKEIKNPDVALGFTSKSEIILEEEFNLLCNNVKIATDDGSYGEEGYVGRLAEQMIEINKYDYIFACGPVLMMKAVQKLAKEKNIPIFLSLEERMACGIGACDGCVAKIIENGKSEYKRVCADGPVFDGSKVVL